MSLFVVLFAESSFAAAEPRVVPTAKGGVFTERETPVVTLADAAAKTRRSSLLYKKNPDLQTRVRAIRSLSMEDM